MEGDRAILHSDLNSFYASVEIMLDPNLRGKPVAVCGDSEQRHGIVLAKSEEAKRMGVKTAMVNWEAKRLCPDLIMIPPHFEQYAKYSRLTREIYLTYTDQVEPFGMDECWLDVTASRALFGSPLSIAETIRRRVREELGLTVSIGVSFNKVFAKLGSDLKKPDAITVIHRENFREKVWPLPVEDLLFVGKATLKLFRRCGIRTIGQLACTDPDTLRNLMGKSGDLLWRYANGLDDSRVLTRAEEPEQKSVSHGHTAAHPMETEGEIRELVTALSQEIASRLRAQHKATAGVRVAVRDETLHTVQFQTRLRENTQSAETLAQEGMRLFVQNYGWKFPVRLVTLSAYDLVEENAPRQISLFVSAEDYQKERSLHAAIDGIRGRFGPDSVRPASMIRATRGEEKE